MTSPTSRCAWTRPSSSSRPSGWPSCAARRDAAEVRRRLDEVRRAAAGTDNLLYPLREALAALATVGEVCDALREVWGVYQPPDVY